MVRNIIGGSIVVFLALSILSSGCSLTTKGGASIRYERTTQGQIILDVDIKGQEIQAFVLPDEGDGRSPLIILTPDQNLQVEVTRQGGVLSFLVFDPNDPVVIRGAGNSGQKLIPLEQFARSMNAQRSN